MEVVKDFNPLVDKNASAYLLHPSDFAKNFFYYPIGIGKFLCSTSYITVRNCNEFNSFLIFFVLDGQLTVNTCGKTTIVGNNEIFILDCYEAHSYYTLEKTQFYYIHFDGNNCRHFYNAIEKASKLKLKTPYFNDYIGFINEQLEILDNNGKINEKDLSIFLHKMLCDITEDQCKEPVYQYNNLVSHSLRIIENHYNDFSLSVQKIAKSLNVSQQHLARLFKNDIGHSLYQHILTYRLNVACTLLKNTNHTIEAISEMIGFSSPSNLMLKFKKIFKITPTEYRKLNTES